MKDLDLKIMQYLYANMPNTTISQEGIAWLCAVFKKTKAQQKSDFIAWLNAQKTANSTAINEAPSVSATKVSTLETENNIIDNIITTF